MPIAKFKGVLICSSEDKNYPASNLITDSNKKWKCEEIGLDSVYVVLQLESSSKINGIDIGNECSAFIEVSVGRNGWPIEKFKTILVTSSFMTITESRVSENPNRVRCFRKDALMPDVLDEKWDLIKVTCTQSFNKHVKFGLSFVKVYTPDASSNLSSSGLSLNQSNTVTSPKEKKSCDETLGLPKNNVFAQFRMRSDSSESDKEDTSSTLFSKWKQEKDSPKKANDQNISSAAAIREASTSISQLEKCTKINHRVETPPSKSRKSIENNNSSSKKERLNRYRPAILYDDEDENTSKPKLEKLINQDKIRIEQERKEQLDKKKAKKETTREEKSKQKMESSSDKFKTFLSASVDIQDDDDDDDVVVVKTKSPPKIDKVQSPQVAKSLSQNSDDSDVLPAWKVKNKRPSTSHDKSASKRLRISSSSDSDSDTDAPPKVDISQILRGVVFVISGIQNPERANMRDKGIKMGAKYKPHWNDSCTHLVCAFKNTPKY